MLEPLSPDETQEMVSTLAGSLEDSMRELVLARAEGNPFFIEELVRYLRERGRAGEVPETLQDLLTARIDRLSEPLKRTLQIAAVLGREFPLSLLEAMTPVLDLEHQLAELVGEELLRQKDVLPEPSFSFSHLLIQEVAYRGLLVKSRSELHTRAGRALERLHADRLDDVVEELAEHYASSTDQDKAVHYLIRAGDRVASLFAYREAEQSYLRALERLPAHDRERRLTLFDRIGEVAFSRGALKEALDRWDQALALAAEAGERRRMADLHRKMAAARWVAGEKESALGHLEQGLAALGEDAENLEVARLYHETARIQFRLGEHRRATEWARRALTLGEHLNAADVVSHAYEAYGLTVRAHSLPWRIGVALNARKVPAPETEFGPAKPTFGELGRLLTDDDLGFFIIDKAGVMRYRSAGAYTTFEGTKPVGAYPIPSNEEIARELERDQDAGQPSAV